MSALEDATAFHNAIGAVTQGYARVLEALGRHVVMLEAEVTSLRQQLKVRTDMTEATDKAFNAAVAEHQQTNAKVAALELKLHDAEVRQKSIDPHGDALRNERALCDLVDAIEGRVATLAPEAKVAWINAATLLGRFDANDARVG